VEASALAHPVGLGRVSLAGPLLRLRTDEQLVALFRAGHDEAFGTIHDRYRARLFAYARQMLGGSQSDAEDVLQDVFLRAYNALRTDGRDVALRAWLYRVAHNRCIDQLRRPAPAAEDIFDINRGVSTDLLAEAERREDLRRLIADVRELPEQQRSALLMREMEGLSYNDLAAALGVTVPAVKSLLVRARVGLVEAIEARDTACVEIRDDLASAFDRGGRPSGRAKRHLKDCAGCREYRGALRGLDKSLNGLALPTGPLTMLMKVLGIGGAGSGAAAGGGAVVGGGGAAAGGAVVAGGASVATTVSGGVVAATATKVAAVVAAAAVVGGGAAVEQHHATRHAATAAPAAHVVAAPQRREDLTDAPAARVSRAALVSRQRDARPAVATPHVTKLQAGPDRVTASPGSNAAADQTTGGTTAPDDAAPDPAVSDDTTTTWSGAGDDAAAATGTDASGTTTADGAGSSSATGTTTSSGTASSSGTTTATQASGAGSTTSTGSASSGTGTGNGGMASPPSTATATQTSSPPVASQPAG
jgi:RNA polymerase sigma factor (sigma-70 family)